MLRPREKWNESRSFTRAIFRAVFDSRSSFFAPKAARERLLRWLATFTSNSFSLTPLYNVSLEWHLYRMAYLKSW